MKERPILFNAPMVRAILDGRKTVTRRIVKARDLEWMDVHQGLREPDNAERCPYGQHGDRLYARESFGHFERNENFAPGCDVFYRADGESLALEPWRPSIHMPRWASRITLEVTGVRVETLGIISHEDALAEGVSSIEEYKALWININGAWLPETWVWVADFRMVLN